MLKAQLIDKLAICECVMVSWLNAKPKFPTKH